MAESPIRPNLLKFLCDHLPFWKKCDYRVYVYFFTNANLILKTFKEPTDTEI